MASTSAAGSLHPRYDIFINHRGPDVKLSFVAHLADALRSKNYTAFVDKYDMRKGEKGSEEIQAALENASVQLAIFTPCYAESRHCLNELVDMLKCCEQDPENIKLVPIFFNVKPGDLRKPHEKPFQGAFQDHAKKASALVDDKARKDEEDRIKRWKSALLEATGRDGFELSAEAGDENKLKHKIVDRIEAILGSRIVRKQPLLYPSVGLQTPFTQIEGELEKMRDKVTILGIWGMGGIGKTTLAKELYNEYRKQYAIYTFVNIGGTKTMEDLQKQVLLELVGQKEENILEKYEGWFQKLVKRRVLLVIDNISKADEFSKLVPNMKSLGIGSCVIVTSRDQHVLNLIVRDLDGFYLHEMKVLNFDASHELFSFHAIGNKKHLEKIDVSHPLVDKIVFRCGGLPLALEIIGKHLYGKEKDVWEEVEQSMEITDVLDVLSISYWGLSSKSERMMFLDVACQMIGMLEEDAVDIWKSCAPGSGCRFHGCLTSKHVKDSLCTLKDKALVKVDLDGRLTMHDLLQEMGKKLVGRDSLCGEARGLEEHSHLWDPGMAKVVLDEGKGTKHIRGLSLVHKEQDTIHIDASKFQEMNGIHLLQLDGACIEGDFSKWSPNIRWLQWSGSSLTKVPIGLRFLFLIHLDLSYSKNLTQLWADDNTQVPRFLKVLNLSNCFNLEKIPENLKLLTQLKKLNLYKCISLKDLPSSLTQVVKLVEGKLTLMVNLEGFPDGFISGSVHLLNMYNFPKLFHDFGTLGPVLAFSVIVMVDGKTPLPKSWLNWFTLDELYFEKHDDEWSRRPRPNLSWSKRPKSLSLESRRVLCLCRIKQVDLVRDFEDLEHLEELNLTDCGAFKTLHEISSELMLFPTCFGSRRFRDL